LFVHLRFIDEEMGAFEERDEDAKDREAALLLLLGEFDARAFAAKEVEVRIIENEFEEFAILVGEALENFFLIVHAFFALFEEEDDERERQTHDGDDVAEKLEDLEEVVGHGARAIADTVMVAEPRATLRRCGVSVGLLLTQRRGDADRKWRGILRLWISA
jgi:hypothetical protein